MFQALHFYETYVQVRGPFLCVLYVLPQVCFERLNIYCLALQLQRVDMQPLLLSALGHLPLAAKELAQAIQWSPSLVQQMLPVGPFAANGAIIKNMIFCQYLYTMSNMKRVRGILPSSMLDRFWQNLGTTIRYQILVEESEFWWYQNSGARNLAPDYGTRICLTLGVRLFLSLLCPRPHVRCLTWALCPVLSCNWCLRT